MIVVENKKLPTFSLRISIDNPPTNEGDKSGLSQLSSALFGEGSSNVSKDVFNEEVDYLGATISMGMGFAYANGLSKHKERIIELDLFFEGFHFLKYLETKSLISSTSTSPETTI